MVHLGECESWSDANRIKDYLKSEGIDVKLKFKGKSWVILLYDDDYAEIARSMYSAARNAPKPKERLRKKLPESLKRFKSKLVSFVSSKPVFISLGAVGLFLCVGYYQLLPTLFRWPPKEYIMALEIPLEIYCGFLVLNGLFLSEAAVRRKWAEKTAVVTALAGVCLIAYNYLKMEGAIDDWQKRRPDTIAYNEKFKGFMKAFRSNLGGQRTMDLQGQIPPEGGEFVIEDNGGINIGGGVDGGKPIVLYNKDYADDPTMEKLKNFLKADKTDKKPYVMGEFVCADFAEQLHNAAEEKGIKCGYVTIGLTPTSGNPDGVGHALVAFRLRDTDRVIYVDCTGQKDPEAFQIENLDSYSYQLKKGLAYRPQLLFPEKENYEEEMDSMGIITKIKIHW